MPLFDQLETDEMDADLLFAALHLTCNSGVNMDDNSFVSFHSDEFVMLFSIDPIVSPADITSSAIMEVSVGALPDRTAISESVLDLEANSVFSIEMWLAGSGDDDLLSVDDVDPLAEENEGSFQMDESFKICWNIDSEYFPDAHFNETKSMSLQWGWTLYNGTDVVMEPYTMYSLSDAGDSIISPYVITPVDQQSQGNPLWYSDGAIGEEPCIEMFRPQIMYDQVRSYYLQYLFDAGFDPTEALINKPRVPPARMSVALDNKLKIQASVLVEQRRRALLRAGSLVRRDETPDQDKYDGEEARILRSYDVRMGRMDLLEVAQANDDGDEDTSILSSSSILDVSLVTFLICSVMTLKYA